jgi:hypothetical protein
MDRLNLGDTFYNNPSYPYTVVTILDDGYVIRQEEDTPQQHDISTIHNLFKGEDSWTLKRKPRVVLPEDLFKI